MNKLIIVVATVLTVLVGVLSDAQAQHEVPDILPVQGILTDVGGATITGNANMQFAVYDAATGGNLIWSELHNGVNQVSVVDGFFTVYLGNLTTILWEDWMVYDEWWLGITVGLDEEMDRVRMQSVPFAIESKYCRQIGALTEEDIQTQLDFTCGGNEFLRGYTPTGGAICDIDITSAGVDGGTITDVYAGTGLNKIVVGGNPSLSVNFGNTTGTAAQGDHNHDGTYQTELTGGPCLANEFIANIDIATGAITCQSESTGTAYTAGVGLSTTVVGSDIAFSVDTSIIQLKLTGSCETGEFVSSIDGDLGTFECATPAGGTGGTYTAGEGILIGAGDQITVDYNFVQHRVSTTGTTTVGTCNDGFLIKGIDPATGLIQCAADSTASGSGTGISTISTTAPLLGGGSDATTYLSIDVGSGAAQVAAGNHLHDGVYPPIGETLAGMTCTDGQVVKYDGVTSSWICATDSTIADTNAATLCSGVGVYLDGEGTCTAINLAAYQLDVANTTCSLGIAQIANDGTLICSSQDNDTTYTGGIGITVAGTVVSVNLSGTGVATTLSRSDHDHNTLYATLTHAHAWTAITGKPTEFNPAPHTHGWAEVTGKPAKYDDADLLDGFDSTFFAATTHDHAGDYSDTSHDHNTSYYLQTEVNTLLAGKSDTAHTHTGYANTTHLHDADDIATGTLSSDRYSAYADLGVEGVLDNNAGADLLTRTQLDGRFAALTHSTAWTSITGAPAMYADSNLLDGLDSTAFSLTSHNHTGVYMPMYTCADGAVLKWSGSTSTWSCAMDDSASYSAGEGILIDGSNFVDVDFSVAQRIVNIGGDSSNGACGPGEFIAAIDPSSGAITCAVDQTTGSTGGEITSVTGVSPIYTTNDGLGHVNVYATVGTTSASVAAGDHLHNAVYVNEGQANSITSGMITDGTIAFADLAAPFTGVQCDDLCTDANTTYTAGTGITIGAGDVISSTLGTSIEGSEIAANTIGAGNIGAIGACDNICTDANTEYTAGAGISIAGGAVSATLGTAIDTSEITNGTILAADLSTAITTGSCSSICTDANTTYTAGSGLSLSGGAFSAAFGSTAGTISQGNHTHSGYAASTHYHSAADVTSGTLAYARYSAYGDLTDEGYLDNNAPADILTQAQLDARFSSASHGHTHASLTDLTSDDHTQYFNLSQNETVSGIPSFNGGTTGSSAPFSTDSTYKVTNLNADLLDGLDSSNFLTSCTSCNTTNDARYISLTGETWSPSSAYDLTYTGIGSFAMEINYGGSYTGTHYPLRVFDNHNSTWGLYASVSNGSSTATSVLLKGVSTNAEHYGSGATSGSVTGVDGYAYTETNTGDIDFIGVNGKAQTGDVGISTHDYYGGKFVGTTYVGQAWGIDATAETQSGNAVGANITATANYVSSSLYAYAYGIDLNVNASQNGYAYGILSSVSSLSTTATSILYGLYQSISHSGTSGTTYGIRNYVYGSNSGYTYGSYNRVFTATTDTASIFGSYAYIDSDTSGDKYALYAYKYGGGNYAGYFSGNVHVAGTLTGTTKSFTQPHATDPSKEIVYSVLEGPEHAAFFRGTTALYGGQAIIDLPDHWQQVAAADGITVHLTPIGAWAPLFTASVSDRQVVVESAPGFGATDVEFSYYIVAKRDLFQNFEPVQENQHYKPENEGTWSFEGRYLNSTLENNAVRTLMKSNGTLNQDGTLNMNVAKKLGWNVIPNEEDPNYCGEFPDKCVDEAKIARDEAHARKLEKDARREAADKVERDKERAQRAQAK